MNVNQSFHHQHPQPDNSLKKYLHTVPTRPQPTILAKSMLPVFQTCSWQSEEKGQKFLRCQVIGTLHLSSAAL